VTKRRKLFISDDLIGLFSTNHEILPGIGSIPGRFGECFEGYVYIIFNFIDCEVITDKNSQNQFETYTHVLLLAYNPWDPIVEDFKAELEYVQTKLFPHTHFTVASFDLSKNPILKDNFGIQFSPSLFFVV
jgi:hypothetical protein